MRPRLEYQRSKKEKERGGYDQRPLAWFGVIARGQNTSRFKIFPAQGCRFMIVVGRNELFVQRRIGNFYDLTKRPGNHGTHRTGIDRPDWHDSVFCDCSAFCDCPATCPQGRRTPISRKAARSPARCRIATKYDSKKSILTVLPQFVAPNLALEMHRKGSTPTDHLVALIKMEFGIDQSNNSAVRRPAGAQPKRRDWEMDWKARVSGRLSGSDHFRLSRRALGKMTSPFNVRNLTSRAADGMSPRSAKCSSPERQHK